MDGDCDMGYRCSSGEALGDVLIPTFGLLQAGTEWLGGDCDMRYRCSGGEPLGDVSIFTFWFVTGRD